MKNLVFMMDVDIKGDGRYASSRRAAYKYSIDSWKRWCDKNDCELFVLNELLLDNDKMGICWQRYYLFDILEANDIKYNQILMVDADTIVHPDCPNFFEMTENKLCGVEFDGSWDWVLRGIENYSRYIFDGYMLVHRNNIDLKLLPYEFNMNDMNRKEILADDMLFTKCGWIYQYNAIPNNEENRLTNHFMKKTHEHFYGDLIENK